MQFICCPFQYRLWQLTARETEQLKRTTRINKIKQNPTKQYFGLVLLAKCLPEKKGLAVLPKDVKTRALWTWHTDGTRRRLLPDGLRDCDGAQGRRQEKMGRDGRSCAS